jgi:hypothetical protein
VAEYRDMTVGSLIKGMVPHAFGGRCPFSEQSPAHIPDLQRIDGLDRAAANTFMPRLSLSLRAGRQYRL